MNNQEKLLFLRPIHSNHLKLYMFSPSKNVITELSSDKSHIKDVRRFYKTGKEIIMNKLVNHQNEIQ